MTFGQYIKDRRIDARLTLREFCRQLGIDPSNWSKIERGVSPPPDDAELLESVAQVLSLSGENLDDLRDLASVARGRIPDDLCEEEILSKMPAFFRAIRGQEYDQSDLEELIKGVKHLHAPGEDS